MIVSIVIAAVALIVGTIAAIKERDGFYAAMGFVGILLAALFLLLSSVWSKFVPIDKCVCSTTDTPIVSLYTGSAAEGTFFLGIGNIDNDVYYYYMAETDAGYQMGKVCTDYTYVRESSEVPPHFEVTTCIGFINWYDYLLNVPGNTAQIALYVPENTIYRHFEIK